MFSRRGGTARPPRVPKGMKQGNQTIYSKITGGKIMKVAVFGAGTMGSGIAQVFAAKGHTALMYDKIGRAHV